MKILKKITLFIIIISISLNLMFNTKFNAFANPNFDFNDTSVANVAVLLSSPNDLFLLQLKQNLEDIQKEHKNIRFTFYYGNDNISLQYETLDSILKSDIDLIIASLADTSKDVLENVILKVKPKNVPLILENVSPEVVSKVSNYYNKVAFVSSDSKQQGIYQGQILVDLWNNNKNALDKNNDNILQYVLLQGKEDNPAAINRTRYVISTINDSGIETQQLALVDGYWLRELAKEAMDSLFLKYDGRIEAIIANNDAMAIGAIEALQKYNYNKGDKAKTIAVVGVDGLLEAKNLIDKGFMTGTIILDPKAEAELFYTIGMNLIHNLNPIENTNYKIVNGEIIIPYPYDKYITK
ncbi:galactose ABC transporter substrate-binding protein [Clostridium saccharoperbutylacetonicum]|uniref:galactose ABC transporter substrate-binding protein n=1 Tax=Clostridium saccharoperbutylacetonicum TaxID=36745 RepID=UPI00156FCC5D|nr:galactose ABC transporter substrate-binding protein [Clostridium saccharoperbutylacetonicum]NSB30256.1 methyl-galactoside transport system substrate-binding protein [Clostridium saccharoperbutylacetonicum]